MVLVSVNYNNPGDYSFFFLWDSNKSLCLLCFIPFLSERNSWDIKEMWFVICPMGRDPVCHYWSWHHCWRLQSRSTPPTNTHETALIWARAREIVPQYRHTLLCSDRSGARGTGAENRAMTTEASRPQLNWREESLGLRLSSCLSIMESPTREIEEFEGTSLKYLQPDQIEKIWLRLRGLWVSAFQQLFCVCSSKRLTNILNLTFLPKIQINLNKA